MEKDIKNLSITGDDKIAIQILQQVYIRNKTDDSQIRPPASHQEHRVVRDISANERVDAIENYIDVTECKNIYELLIKTIRDSFGISSNEAKALLAQDQMLLAPVLIKGLKGSVDKVIIWIKSLTMHAMTILQLIGDSDNPSHYFKLMLNCSKPALYCKSSEVIIFTLKLLLKYGASLENLKLNGCAWEWLVASNGGMEALIYASTKGDFEDKCFIVLFMYGHYNLYELFTFHIKGAFQTPQCYIRLMISYISYIAKFKQAKTEIVQSGVLEFWIKLAVDCMNTDDIELKQCALVMISDIWLNLCSELEEEGDIMDNIILAYKKLIKHNNSAFKVITYIDCNIWASV